MRQQQIPGLCKEQVASKKHSPLFEHFKPLFFRVSQKHKEIKHHAKTTNLSKQERRNSVELPVKNSQRAHFLKQGNVLRRVTVAQQQCSSSISAHQTLRRISNATSRSISASLLRRTNVHAHAWNVGPTVNSDSKRSRIKPVGRIWFCCHNQRSRCPARKHNHKQTDRTYWKNQQRNRVALAATQRPLHTKVQCKRERNTNQQYPAPQLGSEKKRRIMNQVRRIRHSSKMRKQQA